MNQSLCTETDALWQEIAPHLDAALGELSEPERDVVLLRYFEHKSAREMAQSFGISDEAAQKRVTRAVERLRQFLAKRGITVAANGLIVLIGANAVQAAPVGLAATISAAAALAGTALTTTVTATEAIAMTTLQKTVIATVLTAAIGTGVYEGAQNSKLRDQVQTLERQQAPLVQQLQRERDEATSQLAALQAESERLKSNQGELLQLRGEVARLRGEASRGLRAEAELAQLKAGLQGSATAVAANADPGSNALFAYLGEAVPTPPNIDPAYSKEGLVNAVQQAAQLAGVSLKNVEVETSEFPFIIGLACDGEADFKKLEAQFKKMPNYEYRGCTSGGGTCAFNMTPYQSFPSDAAQRIGRRTLLRTQMLYDQLSPYRIR